MLGLYYTYIYIYNNNTYTCHIVYVCMYVMCIYIYTITILCVYIYSVLIKEPPKGRSRSFADNPKP